MAKFFVKCMFLAAVYVCKWFSRYSPCKEKFMPSEPFDEAQASVERLKKIFWPSREGIVFMLLLQNELSQS
jgi:hypothetical protein